MGKHAQFVSGAVPDALIQFAFRNPGSGTAQFLYRLADNAPYLDDDQQEQEKHGQNGYCCHIFCQIQQFLKDFGLGNIGDCRPVTARNFGNLNVCIIMDAQSCISGFDLLIGIDIHAVCKVSQFLACNFRVTVPDNGVRSGIHQEDAACLFKLDAADDAGYGIQVYVRRGHAQNLAAGAFQHA